MSLVRRFDSASGLMVSRARGILALRPQLAEAMQRRYLASPV
jgi:hypothetical protein